MIASTTYSLVRGGPVDQLRTRRARPSVSENLDMNAAQREIAPILAERIRRPTPPAHAVVAARDNSLGTGLGDRFEVLRGRLGSFKEPIQTDGQRAW
jgi:hypothetical protein